MFDQCLTSDARAMQMAKIKGYKVIGTTSRGKEAVGRDTGHGPHAPCCMHVRHHVPWLMMCAASRSAALRNPNSTLQCRRVDVGRASDVLPRLVGLAYKDQGSWRGSGLPHLPS